MRIGPVLLHSALLMYNRDASVPLAVLALSGRPGAEVHGAVNFALTEFYEVRELGSLGSTYSPGPLRPTAAFLYKRRKIAPGAQPVFVCPADDFSGLIV